MVSPSIGVETALHEAYQLGPFRATYQTQATRAGKLTLWGVGLFCLLLVGGCIGLGVWLIVPELNDPFFSPLLWVPAIGFPLVVLMFMFFILWWQFRVHPSLATPIRRTIVVSLYEQGFVYREGRKVQVATWEQLPVVERLALPRKNRPRRYYKLVLKDATEITLPIVIAQIQELGAAIESEMIKRLLPGVLANYDAQKPVAFPGFCLNQDGISKSDESLSWLQIEQVSLAKEKLTIKERGVAKDWFSIPAAQVRNMCVLEALLVRIREDQGLSLDDSPVSHKGSSDHP
jgi:hypothetical protein